MKKILFRIGTEHQRRLGSGNVYNLLQVAYFKGKALGYNDIYLEWPISVTYNNDRHKFMKCPSHSILPIKFIDRRDVDLDIYDKIIDLTDKDALYEGFIPIYENKEEPYGKVSHAGFMAYLNYHYFNENERPIFNLKKDKVDDPYILIHFRNISTYGDYRNPNPKVMYNLFNVIKKTFGDRYKIYKTGEPWRILDRKFDFVAPYYGETDLNELFKLVNNASLAITVASGISALAEMFGVPLIVLEEPKYGSRPNSYGCRTKEWWSNQGMTIGETYYDWVDTDRFRLFWKDKFNIEKLLEFAGKWL